MAFKYVILSALLAVASAGYITSAHTQYAAPVHYAAPAAVVAKVANPSVDAVAQTHQNVVRSFDGTVSQYSKSIQTPYSSVHKEDTRINNNVYTPKTVTYAAPAVTKTVGYAAPAHNVGTVYTTHSAPAHNVGTVYTTHSAPTVTKTVYSSPSHEEQHVYAAPAPTAAVYTHSTPTASVYTHAAPTASVYSHGTPAASVYTHAAPTASVYSHPAPTAAVYTHTAAPTAAVYQHEVPSTATTTTYNHGPAATTYSHNGHGVSAYGSSQTIHYSPAEMVSHMSFDGFGTHWGY